MTACKDWSNFRGERFYAKFGAFWGGPVPEQF